MKARRLARPAAVLLGVFALAGCTETDDVTRDVGVIRVFPTARQSNDAGDRGKPGLIAVTQGSPASTTQLIEVDIIGAAHHRREVLLSFQPLDLCSCLWDKYPQRLNHR